ncbi:MAG: DUF4337 domain-containing protein [Pseudobdellovibrionaceae bacterium]
MNEVAETISNQIEHSEESKLNNWIAIIVALSASFVTIVNIKDNNIVQAMSQAQAHSVDAWSFYQSKSTKQHLAENSKSQVELQSVFQNKLSADSKAKIAALIKTYSDQIAKYDKEKAEIKIQAEAYQVEYDSLNIRDDQFDMSEAMISLAMAILGLSALTKKKSLFTMGLFMSCLGIIFGLAGFIGWNIHPGWLARLLG